MDDSALLPSSPFPGAVDGTSNPWVVARAYVLLVVIPVALALLLLAVGNARLAPAISGRGSITAAGGAATATFALQTLLLQIVVIVSAAWLCGLAMARLGQPRVIGEILGGILLGPTVLGRVAPGLSASLFPAGSLAFVNALAQVGLMLFMFLLGLELDLATLRRRANVAVVTSHASMSLPFLLGVLLSLMFYARYAPPGVSFIPFALFIGAAISVTAFPVLARILKDRRMLDSPLGTIAIACAAGDDVSAWCVLAIATFAAQSDSGSLLVALGGPVIYVAAMLLAGRPLLAWIVRRGGGRPELLSTALLLAGFVSMWLGERLGIHGIFGAFFAGALVPRNAPAIRSLTSELGGVVPALLLPLFFAISGLRTDLSLLVHAGAFGACLVILVASIAGKLGGAAVAGRATGMTWRESLSLGALMNTRGLMELVILNVGLELGILSPELFAMLVIMALVTTAMTTPLLNRVRVSESPFPR